MTTNTKRPTRGLTAAFVLLAACGTVLAACGSGSDEAATPSSLPLAETTTSTTSPPATEPAPAAPELTAEMFENMLATDSGRALLLNSIAAETGLETDAAECVLEALPVEVLVEAASSFLGGNTDGGLFSSDQMSELGPIFESCGVPADALSR